MVLVGANGFRSFVDFSGEVGPRFWWFTSQKVIQTPPVEQAPWWIEQFAKHGWRVHQDTSDTAGRTCYVRLVLERPGGPLSTGAESRISV
eukprot:6469259-Amphidinium_carterae.1